MGHAVGFIERSFVLWVMSYCLMWAWLQGRFYPAAQNLVLRALGGVEGLNQEASAMRSTTACSPAGRQASAMAR